MNKKLIITFEKVISNKAKDRIREELAQVGYSPVAIIDGNPTLYDDVDLDKLAAVFAIGE